jgi:hypothetical protein
MAILDSVTFTEVAFERMLLRNTRKVSRTVMNSSAELTSMMDHETDAMLMEMTAEVAAIPRSEWDSVQVRSWASTWDMWKACKCPERLRRLFSKPKMRSHTYTRRRHWTELYPEMEMPSDMGTRGRILLQGEAI